MLNTANKNILTAFGLVTILFWLSFIFYLPSIQLTSDMKDLVSEARKMKEIVPKMDKPQEVLEGQLLRSLRILLVKSLLIIIIGVTSGILVLLRKRSGQILAIGACLGMLVLRAVKIAGSYPHIWERLYAIYVLMIKSLPIQTIHNEIIAPLFFIASIVLLTRKPISKEFGKEKHE